MFTYPLTTIHVQCSSQVASFPPPTMSTSTYPLKTTALTSLTKLRRLHPDSLIVRHPNSLGLRLVRLSLIPFALSLSHSRACESHS